MAFDLAMEECTAGRRRGNMQVLVTPERGFSRGSRRDHSSESPKVDREGCKAEGTPQREVLMRMPLPVAESYSVRC
jgi:hypothetical protein